MVFSSLTFLFGYFPIVLFIMYIVPIHFRNFALFILSLIFYGWGEPIYILIMLLSTVVDYINGYFVFKYLDHKKIAKRFVVFSIVFNLGMLGFFKYYDFIVTSINSLGFTELKTLGLALPIGISFYSFQTMSYPIDIYRKQANYQKNIINFGTYVTMFPQLIAGPIVRYKDIATQLNQRETNHDKFASGVSRFVVGLAKKVILANNIGIVYDSLVILNNSDTSYILVWLASIAFCFQIYFDFSGYSDMAIGLGRMLGFEFLENFNYPYIANSITDFWRRWHISLSTFFRDYVYIPLGGNRKGIKRQLINISIVWLLTGIWHGANYNFIFWGIFFAIVLILEKLYILNLLDKTHKIIRHIYTLTLVIISFTIFAIEDLSILVNHLKSLLFINDLVFINDLTIFYLRNNIVLLIILIIASTPLGNNIYKKYQHYKIINLILILIGLFISISYLVNATYNPFLYFRF